jgi:hypothetical protein
VGALQHSGSLGDASEPDVLPRRGPLEDEMPPDLFLCGRDSPTAPSSTPVWIGPDVPVGRGFDVSSLAQVILQFTPSTSFTFVRFSIKFSNIGYLCRFDRVKQRKVTDFVDYHRERIDWWNRMEENVLPVEGPHNNANFRAYLTWYHTATRYRLRQRWTKDDYTDIASSDDENTTVTTRPGKYRTIS